MSSKHRHFYQFCYVKLFSTNQYENLVLLDDPGRVRSQITSVVCKIQRFDFDCNLVVTRKVIIRTRASLRTKPLMGSVGLSRFISVGIVANCHSDCMSLGLSLPPICAT